MPDPISWAHAWPYFALALAGGYALGAIPVAYILTRFAGLGDIRSIGSHNVGATNVLRTGNKPIAAATLLLDMGKGALAAGLGTLWGPDIAVASAAGAFFGHLFPVWLGFRGGKGVATCIGILLMLHWPAALAFGVVWLGAAAATRLSSIASLTAAFAAPATAALTGAWQIAELSLVFGICIMLKHRGNITRLLRGTEPRIGRRAPDTADPTDTVDTKTP